VAPPGHRREAQRGHGVDFLTHAHRPDLRREARIGAPGKDDCRQDDAELAVDRVAHQFDSEDRGTEIPERGGADKGHDHADEIGKKGNNGQGVEAGLLHDRDGRRPANPPGTPKQLRGRPERFAEEGQCGEGFLPDLHRSPPGPLQNPEQGAFTHRPRLAAIPDTGHAGKQRGCGRMVATHAERLRCGRPCSLVNEKGAGRIEPPQIRHIDPRHRLPARGGLQALDNLTDSLHGPVSRNRQDGSGWRGIEPEGRRDMGHAEVRLSSRHRNMVEPGLPDPARLPAILQEEGCIMDRLHLVAGRHRAPLRAAFAISRGSKSHADTIRVQVSDGRHTGRGESVPYARYGETVETALAAIEALQPAFEASEADRFWLQTALPAGAARCAIDCAFGDLEAK